MRQRRIGGVFVLVLVGILVAHLASRAAAASSVTAKIVEPGASLLSWGYAPNPLTVSVGDTVTWTNAGLAAHTVTSDDGKSFDSGNVAHGGTFRFTATAPGTFAYHCTIHRSMEGTLIVQAATSAPTATVAPAAPTTVPTMTTGLLILTPTAPLQTTATVIPVPPTVTVAPSAVDTAVPPIAFVNPSSTVAVSQLAAPAIAASPAAATTPTAPPPPVAPSVGSGDSPTTNGVTILFILGAIAVLTLVGFWTLRSRA